jgi:chromosome segregation ATPase
MTSTGPGPRWSGPCSRRDGRRWSVSRLQELVERYAVALDQERHLLRRMREVQRELDEVTERIRRAETSGWRVREEDLDERDKLLAELHELQDQHDDLLEDQARLRGEIAWEEYQERRRRLIEGQAQDDLDAVQRVLELWPWSVPNV